LVNSAEAFPGRWSEIQIEARPMTATPEILTDLVLARVKVARRALDQESNARPSERPASVHARPADPSAPNLQEGREIQSLKRVFRDLGVTYRRYRSQIGGPVAPGLRTANDQFRAAPSLASLVAVAAILEQLDLLS
jgi:hypothetical protein